MPADAPLLSIIVAAYNVEEYVAQAIESALAQTYPEIEVVVVNDGSTDGTAAVLDRYRGRIVRVDQENAGLPAARNAGIAAASGELIGVLDGDDWWGPTRAQRLIEFLAEHDEFDAVTSDHYIVDVDVVTDRRWYHDQYGRAFPTLDEQPARIAYDNFVSIGAIAPASVLARIGNFDAEVRVSSDYDLWIRAILSGMRIGLLDEPLAYYRVRPGSLTADPAKHWTAHLRVVERHIDGFRAAHVHVDARSCYDLAREAESRGDRRAAARWYVEGLRGQPTPSAAARLKLCAAAARALVAPKAHATAAR